MGRLMHASRQPAPGLAAPVPGGDKPGAGATSRVARRPAPGMRAIGTPTLSAHETIADYAGWHASGMARAAAAPNRTGLPEGLKHGIEALSGLSFDDVRVHRNSTRPAQLQALAHTQGSDIHLAPGQERHLPHEAWHVVQQKQGRVRPTMRLGGTAINDDAGLEREADAMGGRATRMPEGDAAARSVAPDGERVAGASTGGVAQRVTVNVQVGQKMIKDSPGGKLAGTEFAWDSKFDLDVVGKTIVVTIKIKAAIAPELFRQVWARQVAEQWSNRFAVTYNGETYPIIVRLQQVDVSEHYAVKAIDSGSVYGNGSRGHFGTQNMLEWGVHDVTNVSHEVGHMLGNPDEYGIIEANGTTVDYLANPSDTIMGKPANNPIAAHYGLIRHVAEDELRKIHKNSMTARVDPYLAGRLGMAPLGFNPQQALGVRLKSGSQPKPEPKSEQEESELSKAFASMKLRPPSTSGSHVSQSGPSTSYAISSPMPQSSGVLPSPLTTLTKEERERQQMASNLDKARQKAKLHPDSWVVERLVSYIEMTIAQYERGESRSWCVRATRLFLDDIDQAIREKATEGGRPSFMDEI